MRMFRIARRRRARLMGRRMRRRGRRGSAAPSSPKRLAAPSSPKRLAAPSSPKRLAAPSSPKRRPTPQTSPLIALKNKVENPEKAHTAGLSKAIFIWKDFVIVTTGIPCFAYFLRTFFRTSRNGGLTSSASARGGLY